VFTEKTAKNCLKVLEGAVKKYGKPEALLTDNGKQFVSKVYNKFLEEKRIKHRRTKPYNPKCNGKMKKWFKTLKKPLKKK